MKRLLGAVVLGIGAIALVHGQGSVVHGTIKRIDAASKTVVISTANGAEEVVHFTDKTVVHESVAGAKDSFHGLKEGSEVVAHVTRSGATKSAVEVDKLGKDGLKVAEGTVTKVDAGTKTIAIKTADGTEQTFDMTAHAAADTSKATAAGATKTAKVTVYYTEEGGKKVAHFFKKP
jgi:hypothetical protein